jgi:hypothetical protein
MEDKPGLQLGEPLYTITSTGFIILSNSKYDYASDTKIMKLIRKYGKVVLDDNFNAPIPFIVDGVSVLICGLKFNQPLDNLPSSLRVLQIGSVRDIFFCKFSKSLKSLPHGLEDLRVFANDYSIISKDLGDYIPSTIKYLYLGCVGELDLNILPDSIEELYIHEIKLNLEEVKKIPANLKLLCCDSSDRKYYDYLHILFPKLEVKTVGCNDYWIRLDRFIK